MRTTQRQQPNIRNVLLQEREQLIARTRDDIAEFSAHPRSEMAGEVPDTGDESVAASLSDLENAKIRREIERVCAIDNALARLDSRDFGICSDCDEPIAKARLAAFPTATRCIDCQKLHERMYAHAAMPTL